MTMTITMHRIFSSMTRETDISRRLAVLSFSPRLVSLIVSRPATQRVVCGSTKTLNDLAPSSIAGVVVPNLPTSIVLPDAATY